MRRDQLPQQIKHRRQICSPRSRNRPHAQPICEVLSPGTKKYDLTEKRPAYAKFGVPRLWIIDPEDRTLDAYILSGDKWLLEDTIRDDDPVCLSPFDAVTFKLEHLWPPMKRDGS